MTWTHTVKLVKLPTEQHLLTVLTPRGSKGLDRYLVVQSQVKATSVLVLEPHGVPSIGRKVKVTTVEDWLACYGPNVVVGAVKAHIDHYFRKTKHAYKVTATQDKPLDLDPINQIGQQL